MEFEPSQESEEPGQGQVGYGDQGEGGRDDPAERGGYGDRGQGSGQSGDEEKDEGEAGGGYGEEGEGNSASATDY